MALNSRAKNKAVDIQNKSLKQAKDYQTHKQIN